MNSIPATIEVVEVSKQEYDIIIFAEKKVLKAFENIYENVFYIEESKFEKPMLVVPSFGTFEQASIWKQYWVDVLKNPEKSCNVCPTVVQFLQLATE